MAIEAFRTPEEAFADLPGTVAWDDMDTDARIRWWVWRIGALNTSRWPIPEFSASSAGCCRCRICSDSSTRRSYCARWQGNWA